MDKKQSHVPHDYAEGLNVRCGRFNVGDKGQRYQVMYKDPDGIEHVFGWTDKADGGVLVQSIKLNPSMTAPRVIDRRPPTTDDKAVLPELKEFQEPEEK